MIDFTAVIKDQDDAPMQDTIAMQANGGKEVQLSLGRAASHALTLEMGQQGRPNEELSGEDKFHRGMLAFKVRDCAACTLKAEDLVLIKKLIARIYTPIVVYRSYLLLDAGEAPETEAK